MSCMRRERGVGRANFPDMRKSEQFREFAKECERLARNAAAEHHRKILMEMVETWKKLAEESERKEAV